MTAGLIAAVDLPSEGLAAALKDCMAAAFSMPVLPFPGGLISPCQFQPRIAGDLQLGKRMRLYFPPLVQALLPSLFWLPQLPKSGYLGTRPQELLF